MFLELIFHDNFIKYCSNKKASMIKVIENDLRQLLNQVSFHDTG